MLSFSPVLRTASLLGLCLCLLSASASAGYKPRPWSPRTPDSYPARLTSEKVTIAAEPLILDARAAQVFDKNDMVTAGIMPLAIVIFNDNDFPVRVAADSIELIEEGEHLHSLSPGEAVSELFKKGRRKSYGVPDSRLPGSRDSGNPEAMRDFELKFLGTKVVPAHGKEGGFLYIHPPMNDLRGYLSKARIYIPDIYREDNGSRLIFFEFDLKPVIDNPRTK